MIVSKCNKFVPSNGDPQIIKFRKKWRWMQKFAFLAKNTNFEVKGNLAPEWKVQVNLYSSGYKTIALSHKRKISIKKKLFVAQPGHEKLR
jgi:hypothetical protein